MTPDGVLQVKGLSVQFPRRTAAHPPLMAVLDVSFVVGPGETLGLVGESGSGKTTLARAILRLVPAASGEVLWQGLNLLSMDATRLRRQRRDLQIVFQDPLASLDPRMTVADILGEPLDVHEPRLTADARQARIAAMLDQAGLSAGLRDRYPHEFSGGQCQRVGIARAMMSNPKLLICDEPVSALDVSIRGQIVNLLVDLQRDRGMAMLFISHDLALVRHVSHRVLVFYLGRLIEIAPRDSLFAAPMHPYTRALMAAAAPDRPGQILKGEPSSPLEPPGGCAFRDRCTHAPELCAGSVPRLEEISAGHFVACHRWRELPD